MIRTLIANGLLFCGRRSTAAVLRRGAGALTHQGKMGFGVTSGKSHSEVEQAVEEYEEGEDRAATFYRNSIRKVNINDKGRGKFTQHHLLKLIKLTEKVEQEPLLYEAYYNYLGHFTVIDSTSVDKMLEKAMSFEGCSLDKIVELYANHNYLSYYPHYRITHKLISLTQNDQELYQKLLKVFHQSPLIKFNSQILGQLIESMKVSTTSQGAFSLTLKLLVSRHFYQLFEGLLTREELLTHIVQALEARVDAKAFKPTRKNEVINSWILEFASIETKTDEIHFGLAILGLSTSLSQVFGDNLILIKDQEKLIRALLYLEECPQAYRNAAITYLQSLQLSEDLRVRLGEFAQSKTDPAQVETE